MLAAVLMRNYKCYSNINFIPVLESDLSKYSVYVGNNGVGKSAILEALDSFFNEREWNINAFSKSEDAFICPIFLIDKEKANTCFKGKIEILEKISTYFWSVDDKVNPNIRQNKALLNLLKYRDKVKEQYSDTHYFILIGTQYGSKIKEAYFSTFDKDLRKTLGLKEEQEKRELIELKKMVLGYYSYIYIPVEQSVNEVLKLETREMQTLLNKDLLDDIENLLNSTVEGARKSIVRHINDHLDTFIEEVNKALATVNDEYSYAAEFWSKKNLTARDIREKILEAYFPLRTLKRNKRTLPQLSSGEQRKALIDVAYSILIANGKSTTENNVILAIDEPETSMHISNCFEQFMLLERLANEFDKQILLTTHWYGFLPITSRGYMHHISEKEEGDILVNSFNFYNYLEDKRTYPDVVELKSMFDLATSIITFMRSKPEMNWLICEGSDDKIYLEHILSGEKNIKILPVGGCGNVVKLFQLLRTPISEKLEAGAIDGKILFLIDTDRKQKKVEQPLGFGRDADKIVFIRRLQIIEDEVKLVDPQKSVDYEETEIEDCLNPEVYYESINDVIQASADEAIKDLFREFIFVKEAKCSRLKGDKGCLVATEGKYQMRKDEIVQYVAQSQVKYRIANKYIEKCKAKEKEVYHKLRDEIRIVFD